MCGIAGKIYFHPHSFQKSTEISLIQKTLEKLHHRGPDDEGYFLDKNIWLGTTRLKIIDLSPAGHQPLQNEDKNLALVFNGEIYNYIELKKKLKARHTFISHTDSEVLLHLYEEYGIECLNYLRGMFAFAIWDRRKQELFLARDRLGKKPLKYFYNKNFFIFASELKAFIDHPGVPKEIDREAIDEFLSFGYVPSPKTGFGNIWKLPPGSYMFVRSNGEIEIKRYWQIDYSQKLAVSDEEWEERITQKLSESIKLRLRSDVPIGIHLSGGIDSGLVTAFASIQSKKPLTTVSVGFHDQDFNELPLARRVSETYHTNHHEVYVTPEIRELLPQLSYHYEEPFSDPSMIPTWYLMKESRKYFTVAMNGDGGDENFAGYRRYKILKLFSLLKHIPEKKNIAKLFQLFYGIFRYEDFSHIAKILSFPYSSFSDFFLSERARGNYLGGISHSTLSTLEDVLQYDFEKYLPDNLLTKVDIASMANGLEVRSPFLDHEFVELTAKMPFSFKLRGSTTKYMLKKIAKKYLPPHIVERRKQGFLPPLARWIREDVRKYFRDELSDPALYRYDIVTKSVIMELLEEHIHFKANHAYALFTLLCLKHWLKTWFPH